jgi:hypothetical protein
MVHHLLFVVEEYLLEDLFERINEKKTDKK